MTDHFATARAKALAAYAKSLSKTTSTIDEKSAPFWAWAVTKDGEHVFWECKRKTQAQWRYQWLDRYNYWLGLSAYGWSTKR